MKSALLKKAMGYGLWAMGLMATLPAISAAQDMGIEIGSAGPSAKVFTLDGKEADLGQYVGKTPVLMEFWATWCPNCKELEPAMKAAATKYGDKVKFVFVAVSVNQSPEKVKAFLEKHALPGDHYFDAKGNATGAYDVPATSYVVLLDKTGKVVYTGLGGRQNLEAALKRIL
jgi:thiol-disulfide isomerase/thioredoxin